MRKPPELEPRKSESAIADLRERDQAEHGSDVLSHLSTRQVELLRLINEGVHQSKSLAPLTGLTPGSIDTYIQLAAKILGVDGRKAAAKRMVELSGPSQHATEFSQLRTIALVNLLTRRLFRRARIVLRTVVLPIEGTHSFNKTRIAVEAFRVALLGLTGLTLMALLVLGFMRAFG